MIYNDGEDIYDDKDEHYDPEGPVYSSLAKCGGSCQWNWMGNYCDVGGAGSGYWENVSNNCVAGCHCPDGDSACYT